MIEGLVLVVLGTAALAWLVSPVESLVWWERRGAREMEAAAQEYLAAMDEPGDASRTPRTFLVYLSGIAAFDDNLIARAESLLLRRLQEGVPELTILHEIYPYAVDNRGLIDDRRSGRFWRWFARWQGHKRFAALFNLVVNIRNVYQVMVSVDPRYGPVFSAGIAQTIWRQVRDAGYAPQDRIVLLGWSGGAQIGAGAAWYLGAAGAHVTFLSMGGIFHADPGLERCERIIHLVGTRDWQARWFAPLVFPGRRRWVKRSSWNRALAEGRATQRFIGPFKHVGRGSYLSGKRLPGGESCFAVTVAALVEELTAESR